MNCNNNIYYNNLSAIILWVMALACNIVSFLYYSTSNIVKVVFGLTLISGIYFFIFVRGKKINLTRFRHPIKFNSYTIGSHIVLTALLLYTFIPSNIRSIISIIILFVGFGFLLFAWIYAVLYYKR